MILGGEEIARNVQTGDIEISPFNPEFIGPNSYDLHLGMTLATYTNKVLDPAWQNEVQKHLIVESGYILYPGTLYLAHTVERTKTEKFVPMLEGISSLGRLGLFVHVTAGFGDVGFSGQWTLEMSCIHPIKIYPGMRICQVYFHTIEGKFKSYSDPSRASKYNDSEGVVPSKSRGDFNG